MKTTTYYRLVRHFENKSLGKIIVRPLLTFTEVRKHCDSPEASSLTAKGRQATRRTAIFGAWYDGYEVDPSV